MASNAIVAPRGSPFVTETGNLTPAWHHYLANIETLTTDLVTTFDGQALLAIEARISALEDAVTALEEAFPKRNWRFFYTANAPVSSNKCTVVHDLDTKLTLSRVFTQDQGKTWSSALQDGNSNTGNSITFQAFGNGAGEAWVLGLYPELS